MRFNKRMIGEILVVTPTTPALSTRLALDLRQELQTLRMMAEKWVLIDMCRVRWLDFGALAHFVDLAQNAGRFGGVAFAGLRNRIRRKITGAGLGALILDFADLDAAFDSDELRNRTLCGTKALILCAGSGTRSRPLTRFQPKPMLEVMGKPLLHHAIDHLRRFGIQSVALNTSYLFGQIEDYFGSGRSVGIDVQYSREGRMTPLGFVAEPVGSASSLLQIQERFRYFDRDFVVLCGDAIINIDLHKMMEAHIASGAIATVATKSVPQSDVNKYGILTQSPTGRATRFQEKPSATEAQSRQANCGIYIFSPRAIEHVAAKTGEDIGGDLLPRLISRGEVVQAFDAGCRWIDVGCGRDLFEANQAALRGLAGPLIAEARQSRPRLWIGDGAFVSRKADIRGEVFVGAGARVEDGACLRGSVVISAGSKVAGRTFVRDTIVLPDTSVGEGAVVDGLIAGGAWSVAHRLATAETAAHEPPEFVYSQHVRETVQAQVTRKIA